jgi:pimeloyl-ACP methyl ester carboxylesterase
MSERVAAEDAVRERRGFVNTPHGQTHYRVSGTGPPVVLLHDSPRSSAMHGELIRWLGGQFTAIAIDTPGYGNSAPLPSSPQPEIADFAHALSAALDALGLTRCSIYGYHTSSKIVLELAVARPERLNGAILDGLSLPLTPSEPDFIARYMRPFDVSEDGSHLAREWTRIRDLHRFFPWFAKSGRSRIHIDLPEAQQLHRYAIDVFSAGRHYPSAYAAAMRHQAIPLISRVRVPSVVMCRADDVLFRYLDALPENRPSNMGVERLSADRDTWRERLRSLFRQFADTTPAHQVALPDPLAAPPSSDEVRGYVSLSHGQVLVRRQGTGSARPVLLLHETPGSSAQMRPLMQELARDRTVIAVDLPGLGDSDPLPDPDAAAYARALGGVLEQLRLTDVDVIAEFTAAPLALELARWAPNRVHRLVLDGAFVLGASERRALLKYYCPVIRASWDGSHLLALWHRLRDQEFNWPWYDDAASAIRRREPEIGAERLQGMLLDVMKRLDHYGDACRAAIDYPMKDQLGEVRQPVLLAHVAEDIRYQWTRKLARRLENSTTQARAAGVSERARAWAAFLAQ